MLAGALLGAVLAAQVAASTPPPEAAPPAAPDTAETAAVDGFLEVCLAGLVASHTPAEYAANSDEVGRSFAHQHPDAAGVTVDGFDGRACRVRYTGPTGGQVFVDLTGMTAVSGCVQTESSDVLIRSRCTAPDGGPAGDIEVIRPQPVDAAPITATIVYLPGAPPPASSAPVPTARP